MAESEPVVIDVVDTAGEGPEVIESENQNVLEIVPLMRYDKLIFDFLLLIRVSLDIYLILM